MLLQFPDGWHYSLNNDSKFKVELQWNIKPVLSHLIIVLIVISETANAYLRLTVLFKIV